MTLTREQVEAIHASIYKQACTIVPKEEHQSLLFGFEGGEKPACRVIGMYPLTDASKNVLPHIMQSIAAEYGLAVHVFEAWAVALEAKDVKDNDDPLEGVRPSVHPARQEVLIMIFVAPDWKAFARHPIATVDGVRSLAEGKLEFEDGKMTFGGKLMGGGERRSVQ